MALLWRFQGLTNFLHLVLWLEVMAVWGFENTYGSSRFETLSSVLGDSNEEHSRNLRSTEDQTFNPLTTYVNKDVDNSNHSKTFQVSKKNKSDIVWAKEEKKSEYNISEDEVKFKHKLQKYIFNSKNYSISKIASNESINERQKSSVYGSQGLKNNNMRKEVQLNLDNHEQYPIKNISLPVATEFHKNSSQLIELRFTNLTEVESSDSNNKVNETGVMNDQPAPIDNLNNSTDLSGEDSIDFFPDNTTSSLFDEGNTTTSADRTVSMSDSWDVLIVSGIICGSLVIVGFVAGGGYVFYRHRLWNKPQTLSDKCSNADSSGYIDDSTLRENSEEMYSLDNDSFLNSLEAMTIQNYWTDNVKHTKL